MAESTRTLQTPGAGSSRSRPADISIPPPTHLPVALVGVRPRTPTRASTSVYEQAELGPYLRPDTARAATPTDKNTAEPERGRRGSAGLIGSITSKVTDPGRGFFFVHSIWRTDIITFCSHVRADPSLSNARITHVQARKSRRLPFMHEYLLIFFTSSTSERFVMRIDRLGKASLGSTGGNMGPGRGAGNAIQEVGIYHLQDSQHGIETTTKAPWLAMDGGWGSHPLVTLVAWDMLSQDKKNTSHHVQSAASGLLEHPRLKDVSGLLEGILLEMPNYHLTTANCYLMTRSSLILLHRCYPAAFACYLGHPSGEMISSSLLAEPVWAGLLRWYLPFAVVFFFTYIPLLILLHRFIYFSLNCFGTCNQGTRWVSAVGYAIHSVLDVPLPIGIIHSYMTSIEVQINRLVVNISTQFFRIRNPRTEPVPTSTSRKPFATVVDDAWLVLIGWLVLGGSCGILLFISAAIEYGVLAVFIGLLIVAIWFNFKFGSNGAAEIVLDQSGDLENFFGPPPAIELPSFT
ncbi:unnamed protein product [Rhizoctonia solani]|uniref:Uncharacterized protein n=1 Tax=Rhizoctonia solani TaxID=456999 RepID=A0A8H3A2U1_9AGAM|nr:unnamed protein product [Rhizoctonia solani]